MLKLNPFLHKDRLEYPLSPLEGEVETIGLLKTAFLEAAGSNSEPADQTRLEKVEKLRAELLANKKVIQLPDFGAGPRWKRLLGFPQPEGKLKKAAIAAICKQSSKAEKWCFLLYQLVRTYRPQKILEMGTSLGISAAYMALAAPEARLITIEGAPQIAEIARENLLDKLGLKNVDLYCGTFSNVLPSLLEKWDHKIDFVFLDGHHDEQATWQYWSMLKPHLSKDAVVVFDDIHWSAGMHRAWKRISGDARVSFAADTGQLGIALTRGV